MSVQSTSPGAQPERLPSLDGWRAVAIVLVLVSHTVYTLGCPAGVGYFIGEYVSGNFGVRIFFTISGFIITWLLIQEGDKNGSVSLSRFYTRRSLRIFPVYFCYLAALGALSYFGRYRDAPSSWLGALTFSRNMIGRGDSATVHFWSLAVEEQFYICWPLAFKLLKLNSRVRLAVILLLAAVLLANGVRFFADVDPRDLLQSDRIYGARSLLRYADCIAIGCLAAYGYAARKTLRRSFVYLSWLVLLSDFLLQRYSVGFLNKIDWLLPTVEAMAIALVMVDSIDRPKVYGILNTRFAVLVGLMSYSLYVWHMVFVHHFAPDATPGLVQQWWLWFVGPICISYLSYTFVERPIARLRKRLEN